MAYFTDQYPGLFGDENPQNAPFQTSQAGIGASLVPSGPGLGGGSVRAQGGAPGALGGGGVPGSKFVNFDRLMAANRDSAKASADRMVGGVADQAQKAEQGQVDYAKQHFGDSQPLQFVQADVSAPNAKPDTRTEPQDPYSPKSSAEQVTKDTLAAQQSVNALGSAEGYRSLFDDPTKGGGGSQGARDFSAALSYGFAQPGARDLAAKYGDLTKRLTGTFADARTQTQATQAAQNAPPAPKPDIVIPKASDELTGQWRQVPGGYTNISTGEFVSDADARAQGR